MIMIVGFSEIPLYSAMSARTQLALIKECWVLSILSPWIDVEKNFAMVYNDIRQRTKLCP